MTDTPNDEQTLMKLVSLCKHFRDAVSINPEDVRMMRASLTPDQTENLKEKFGDHADLCLVAAWELSANGNEEAFERKIAPSTIEFANLLVGFYQAVMPAEKCATFFPEEARNEETAAAFRKQGAENLAKLCIKAP